MNWADRTTDIKEIGYVVAYELPIWSVFATLINVPKAGVDVIAPVKEPKLFNKYIFKIYLLKKKPTIKGIIVINIS